jgi:hypothetical protein
MRWILGVAALATFAACAPPLEGAFFDANPQQCNPQVDGSPACDVPEVIDGLPVPDGQFLLDNSDVERGSDGTTIADVTVCGSAHRLSLQLYPGHGILDGGIVGDTFDLSAESEHSFKTCGVCLLLLSDVDPHGAPTRTYMAQEGTLVVQSFGAIGGAKFIASLGNVTFREVHIDPVDFTTTVASECSSRLPGIGLRGPVRALE